MAHRREAKEKRTNYNRIVETLNYKLHLKPQQQFGEAASLQYHFGIQTDIIRERTAWTNQLRALNNARVFHFNPDASFLLSITDNNLEDEIRLPYPNTFLEFTIPIAKAEDEEDDEETKDTNPSYLGILLTETEGFWQLPHTLEWWSLGPDTVKDAERIIQKMRDNGTPEDKLPKVFPFRHILGAIYVGSDNEQYKSIADFRFPLVFMTDEQKATFPPELLQSLRDNKTQAGYTSDIIVYDYRTLLRISLNFLYSLESHHFVIRKREYKGRYMRKDEMPKVTHYDVDLNLPLRQYVDRVKSVNQDKMPFTARWVRGHWKHWRDERYTKKRGQRTYVAPYPQGYGEPRIKDYVVDTDYENPNISVSDNDKDFEGRKP